MRNRITIIGVILLLQLGGWNCKQEYNPPAIKNTPHLLVVDGVVINGNDSTVITLTRTRSLADTTPAVVELGAQVSILSPSGAIYPLVSEGNGRYEIDQLFLDTTQLYQLKIVTADGNEFRSQLDHVYAPPPIDSLNFTQDGSGVHVFVNTHDPTNSTRYYRWQYLDTWEYVSDYQAALIYVDSNNIVDVSQDYQNYFCYQFEPSSSIQVATTTQLSSDIVSEHELEVIPPGSEKISMLYSMLVNQYGVSVDAYNFWSNLKKNTEQLGSLFDVQPFTELGNITCVNNPSVQCIGFISFSSLQQKRIFISRNQVNPWNYIPYYGGDCALTYREIHPDSLSYYFQPPGGPYFNSLIGTDNGLYILNTTECVDCRQHGGTSIKPPYWP
jgi:hypothetical protein